MEYRLVLVETEVYFRFKTYYVFDHAEEELLDNPNPIALVILPCQAEILVAKLSEVS